MGSSEKFCLRWNDFESNISVAFREIREEKDFFDCTLSCGSRQIQAHKLILSACSPFFRSILKQNPHQHPLLYLKGVQFTDLQAILNFMYHGEVNVAQEELNSFLAVAEDLKIKGLTQSNSSEPKQRTVAPKHRPVNVQEGPRAAPVTTAPPTPQGRNQYRQDDEEIQEVQLAVKTEPEHHQVQQLSHSSASTPVKEQVQVSNQVASMEENYVEEDAYDYAGYDADEQGAGYEGYDAYNSSGFEAGGLAETNKGKDIFFIKILL